MSSEHARFQECLAAARQIVAAYRATMPVGVDPQCIIGSIISPLLETKPKVPQFEAIDPKAVQSKAIADNLANFGAATELAGKTNQFNQQQLLSMLRAAIPNYDQIMSQGSGRVLSFLGGEIPGDVSSMVKRHAAEKGVAGGYGGSGMARNLAARDLGLTSLDITSKGLQAANQWLSNNRTLAPITDASSMFFSPEQQLAHSVGERNSQFQRDYVNEQVDAQYSLGSKFSRGIAVADQMATEMASSFLNSMGSSL